MSEKIFCLRPQYLAEFKCDASKCGALCCRSAWNTFVDAKTYEKYCALPTAKEILRHLQADSSSDRYLIVHDEKNFCPFLDADNLCRVQKAYGEDYLSQVCASYPRIITRFENFLEVALSPTCPVAAKLILFDDKPLRFEVVEASEKFLRLGESHILQGIPHEFAPLIFDVQLTMVKILQERRLTIDGRLIVLGFFLDRIEELLYSVKLNDKILKNLSAVYASESFFSTTVPIILSSVRFDAAAYENLMREIFAAVDLPTESVRKNLPPKFATLAENFLVNEILLNLWPWRIDASIVNNFGVFAAIYKIFERFCSDGTRTDFLSAAADLSRKLDHDGECLTKISALLGDDLLRVTNKLLRA